MAQGKVQPGRVMKESQSSGRVPRENNKTPTQPPNTSLLLRMGFPAAQLGEAALKSFSQPKELRRAAGHPAVFQVSPGNTDLSLFFFSELLKAASSSQNKPGRKRRNYSSLLLHACTAPKAREILLASRCQGTQCPQERAAGLILAVPAAAVSA